nr:L,D-transpeptidase family protein [uncultured Mucilaginibacter sp.]
MITFINNIHFGKYNPDFPAAIIDKGDLPFNTIDLIYKAMQSKDFVSVILNAQPKNQLYKNLQNRMHAVVSLQLDDCHKSPNAEMRKIALNMERLRWAALDTDNFIQVNIPSYNLSFYHKGTVDTFRVIVGKPGNPTPALNSLITHFTTSPEWKVPQKIFANELLPKAIRNIAYLANNHFSIYTDGGVLIDPDKNYLKIILKTPQRYRATQSAGCDNALGQVVFRFANIYDIYLHDTPEQSLFSKSTAL